MENRDYNQQHCAGIKKGEKREGLAMQLLFYLSKLYKSFLLVQFYIGEMNSNAT